MFNHKEGTQMGTEKLYSQGKAQKNPVSQFHLGNKSS